MSTAKETTPVTRAYGPALLNHQDYGLERTACPQLGRDTQYHSYTHNRVRTPKTMNRVSIVRKLNPRQDLWKTCKVKQKRYLLHKVTMKSNTTKHWKDVNVMGGK